MKKLRLPYALLVLFVFAIGCSDDYNENTKIEPGDEAITIKGGLTRAHNEDTLRDNIYMKALMNDASQAVYFNDAPIKMDATFKPSVQPEITFQGTTPTYPFLSKEIRLFAYSGTTTANHNMTLTAGRYLENDAILANYGSRIVNGTSTGVPATPADYKGATGSAKDPVDILQFRHVMTKVFVGVVEIDENTGTRPIDPRVLELVLDKNLACTTGNYAITSALADVATNHSAVDYTMREGVNYLVPTGKSIKGKTIIKLIINDYVATPEDCKKLEIKPETASEGDMNMTLLPGYAYTLTFQIDRLGKPAAIKIERVDWDAIPGAGEFDYKENVLTLDLGTNNDKLSAEITTVMLETDTDDDDKKRTYVGAWNAKHGGLSFITLPPASAQLDSVAFFTKDGLLLATRINQADRPDATYNASNKTLKFLNLSPSGMLPVDPKTAYNASTNPYAVTTPAQFRLIKVDMAASYRLMNNISAYNLEGFTGFGTFTGIFDGNGFRVDEVNMKSAGLFAVNQGILKNVRIGSGQIRAAGTYTGGICGDNQGQIVGCINEAWVKGDNNLYAGGICGKNSTGGTVKASVNTGVVSGSKVGGICGYNEATGANTFVGCINTGSLSKSPTMGYIVGKSENSANNVLNTCYGLVGSAQNNPGDVEKAVGEGTVGTAQVADLDPPTLRSNGIITKLSTAVSGTDYKFSNAPSSALTWPIPVKK